MLPFPFPAWESAFTGYELSELSRGHSPRSISTRRSSVLALARAADEADPELVGKKMLRKFFSEQAAWRKPGGMAALFNDIKAFFTWLAADAGIANPMAEIPRPKAGIPETAVLTLEQIKAILDACGGKDHDALRDRAIILFFLETGVRRTELISLDLADVDERACEAVIRKGKGGKSRIVVYGPDTATALRKWLRVRAAGTGEPSLFTTKEGNRLGYSGVGQMLQRRGKQAGVPGLRPHLFRHSWAHYSLSAGVQERNLITLAGWTTGAQLARYGASMATVRARADGHAHNVGAMLRQRA
jgi:integrase